VGIFASVAAGATPLTRKSWGVANQATGRALTVIGALGGPRCCKRTTWLAILSGIQLARKELGAMLEGLSVTCAWVGQNAECLGEPCPFHPDHRSARASASFAAGPA
jgi:hypothetical protein